MEEKVIDQNIQQPSDNQDPKPVNSFFGKIAQ